VKGLLIDWLTLRIPLDDNLSPALYSRVMEARLSIHCCNVDGEIVWQKQSLDFDALRSDTIGLCWQIQGDGIRYYLVIGGSPASLEHGINVFGDLDIVKGASLLIGVAQKALLSILPPIDKWQCRRIDITGNYLLPDAMSVKQALRMLMNTDAARRVASSCKKGGDTVLWQANSDLSKGKAYHKGPQLAYLCRKKHLAVTVEQLLMADRILRLEHTRGARWFRREESAGRRWQDLTPDALAALYCDFFGKLLSGKVEIKDMNRDYIVSRLIRDVGLTEGMANSIFTTLRNIREDGYEVVKSFMPRATFYRHMKHLRSIGITDGDMSIAKVIPIRPVKVILAHPVASWAEIRRVA
jgi:II/X family phage/plasmid replication protein